MRTDARFIGLCAVCTGMSRRGATPGPIADRAFDAGFKAAAVGGVVGLTVCYLVGILSLYGTLFVLILLYPAYLVFVALLLATWLGYDTDRSNLEPVSVEADAESREPEDGRPR